MRNLQNDKSVIIKLANTGLEVVLWDIQGYFNEFQRQFSDSSIYNEVRVTEKDFADLVDKSNKVISGL